MQAGVNSTSPEILQQEWVQSVPALGNLRKAQDLHPPPSDLYFDGLDIVPHCSPTIASVLNGHLNCRCILVTQSEDDSQIPAKQYAPHACHKPGCSQIHPEHLQSQTKWKVVCLGVWRSLEELHRIYDEQ